MRYIIEIIPAIIVTLLGKFYVSDELRPEFLGSGLIFFIGFIFVLLYDFIQNYGSVMLYLRCKLLALRSKTIRFSMSYQYRIKINDKYLLVKNSNWDFYQHVGGKYKRLPETQKILKDFEATDDLKMKTSGLMKDDLAVFIPAKNAAKFLKWFESGEDREISHWREFYEELIEGKGSVLTKENFPYVNYNFISSVQTSLLYAPQWKCWEILRYDVIDLLPNEMQKKELEELFQKGDTDYVKWADFELIQCLGYNSHTRETTYKIGKHAKWILNLKAD